MRYYQDQVDRIRGKKTIKSINSIFAKVMNFLCWFLIKFPGFNVNG